MDDARNGPARFFGALLLATVIPLLAYALSEVALPESAATARTSLWITFLGSSGHVAASFFFYTDSRVRSHMLSHNPRRFLWVPLGVVAATSALFASGTSWLPHAITLYWIWQTHHYTRQNHGILSFAGRAFGAPPGSLERTALTMSGVAGVLGALTFVAPYRETPLSRYGWHIHHTALGAYTVAWLLYAAAWIRDPELRRAPALRLAVATVLMLFYLPLFVFRNPQLAVGSYAMAHGLQYLIFMGYVAAVPRAALARRAIALVACVGLLGGLLQILQREAPFGDWRMPVFGAYLGLVMWHFLLDAGMWRLSEPFQRAYMGERFAFLRPRG